MTAGMFANLRPAARGEFRRDASMGIEQALRSRKLRRLSLAEPRDPEVLRIG
jgi:hypothetical protein